MSTDVQTEAAASTPTTSPAVDAWLAGATGRRMEIGLAGLKHMASLSQETHAYTATVTLDGVRAFEASNHGHGGCDMYHRVKGYTGPSDIEVDLWLKANTPKIQCHGMKLDNSLEIAVGDIIDAQLGDKAFKRMLTTKILVIDKTADGKDALFTYKGKPTPEALASMRRAIDGGRIKGRLVNGGNNAILAEARNLV
jgi:hypothetical protein